MCFLAIRGIVGIVYYMQRLLIDYTKICLNDQGIKIDFGEKHTYQANVLTSAHYHKQHVKKESKTILLG